METNDPHTKEAGAEPKTKMVPLNERVNQARAGAVSVKARGLLRAPRTNPLLTLALPAALKLERDASGYAYLNQKVSRVDGMDDAANFKAVQVGAWGGPLGCPRSPGFGFEKGGVELAPQSSASDFCSLLKSAMTVIGFSEEEIQRVLEVTALVLKLGNVELADEFQANGVSASSIRDGKGLYRPAGTCPLQHQAAP